MKSLTDYINESINESNQGSFRGGGWNTWTMGNKELWFPKKQEAWEVKKINAELKDASPDSYCLYWPDEDANHIYSGKNKKIRILPDPDFDEDSNNKYDTEYVFDYDRAKRVAKRRYTGARPIKVSKIEQA